MYFYDLTGCTARIIQPGMTLTEWVKQYKPYAVCNASLYDFNTRIPIGTIIEQGKLVHNDGNGYGFGTIDSVLSFGTPWEKPWDDYLTGYNAPIQNGVYVPPAFRDDYVFGSKNARIGIGMKGDHIGIVVDDNVTLKHFSDNAIANGITTLVNLDGGGSRHLYYNGKTIYKSPRTPYNAVAFFKDGYYSVPLEFPEPVRNLWFGCTGDDVKWVQQKLTEHGFPCSVDGKYYWETMNTVFKFQKTWSPRPDGICGPNTRGKLKE